MAGGRSSSPSSSRPHADSSEGGGAGGIWDSVDGDKGGGGSDGRSKAGSVDGGEGGGGSGGRGNGGPAWGEVEESQLGQMTAPRTCAFESELASPMHPCDDDEGWRSFALHASAFLPIVCAVGPRM